MTLLARYITSEMLRYFAIILAAVIGIYLAVDFIEKVDDFIEAQVPVTRAFVYLAYKIPLILTQVTPVGVLLAALISFGLMSKHNELIALASSGISTSIALVPALKVALVLALGLVSLSEFFAPLATMRANQIWLAEVRQEKSVSANQQDIWIKNDKSILNIQYYHGESNTAQGISLNRFNDRFQLTYRLDADTAAYARGQWHLKKAVEQTWTAESRGFDAKVHPELTRDLNVTPSDLKAVTRHPTEMGFNELRQYIRNIEADGYDATAPTVDLQAKIAYPFTCLIMGLIGVAVATRGRVRDGLVAGVLYGIGIIFIYWIFYSFCLSLGYGGLLPPWMAAWLANLVFACLGWVLLSYGR